MYADRHMQFGAFFEQWLHSRIVNMQAIVGHLPGVQFPETFIPQFTNTRCPFFEASLKFSNGVLLPYRLIITRVIKAAPYLESVLIPYIFVHGGVKSCTGRVRKD